MKHRYNRRHFIRSLSTAVAAGVVGSSLLPACAPRRRLRILMLGGTNFVGPHLVRTALAREHEITLFNRGVTNSDLFSDLERLIGNRYSDRGAGLAALEDGRRWDAVIDTWQAEPGCIDLTARLLAGRTERYVYISSIATYRHFRDIGMTEDGPLHDAAEHIASFDPELGYATRKRAGEQAVERTYGDRGTVLSCTSIQGPSDSPQAADAGTMAGYWPHRFLTGEPLLAPDDATAFVQLIDVRDMAAFAILAIEQGFGGRYNIVGPEEPLTFPKYLRAWSEAADHRTPIVWAEPDWLQQQGVRPWSDQLLYASCNRPCKKSPQPADFDSTTRVLRRKLQNASCIFY